MNSGVIKHKKEWNNRNTIVRILEYNDDKRDGCYFFGFMYYARTVD